MPLSMATRSPASSHRRRLSPYRTNPSTDVVCRWTRNERAYWPMPNCEKWTGRSCACRWTRSVGSTSVLGAGYWFNSKRWFETADFLDGVVGGGPSVVNRDGSDVWVVGTYKPSDGWLDDYAAEHGYADPRIPPHRPGLVSSGDALGTAGRPDVAGLEGPACRSGGKEQAMTSWDERSDRSKYEALRELSATIEEQNERAENAAHEAISKASSVSTGSPEVDVALARFNQALGQMVAQTGDMSDELADTVAEVAEEHKPTDPFGRDTTPNAEGNRPDPAHSAGQPQNAEGGRPDAAHSRDEASDPSRKEGDS